MNDSKQQLSDSETSQPALSPSKKKDKKVVSKTKNKIVINVSDCQYPVVSKVAKNLGWKKQTAPEAIDWDVCWTDNAVQPETLTKMELHQKINHFPGMYNLARKNLLGRGLMRMRKNFPAEYDFFPLTWMLPVEYHELKAYFQGKAKGKARTFIVKPECLSQGKGIFLTRKLEDINPTSHCVVQRYLHRPYLIDGLKFDLRVYVLIASVDPLTIYLYEEGLGRFATQKYEAPNRQNMEDVCMHLTNYAINKDNPKFVFNESEKDMSKGHKRSLTSVYELLKEKGVDTDRLKSKIKDCIIKTMISGLPHLTNTYRSCQPQSYAANMCFQLLGFDVMLNDKAEPIILEINHTPSFTTDTPLDQYIKFNYIKDALNLMNINEKTKNEVIRMQKEACQQRVMTGKKIKLTSEERETKKKDAVEKKLKYQKNHLGRFQRIYPTYHDIDPYKVYLQFVEDVFQTSMGSKKPKKIEQAIKLQPPLKQKLKRPTLSTTPDLISRKPIAQRKFETKQSLNFIQSENKQQGLSPNPSCQINQVVLLKKPLSSFDRIMKDEDQYRSKLQKQQYQPFVISKTPQQQAKHMLNNYTYKDRQKFQDRDIFGERQFKSIRKIGSIREDLSEKRMSRDKQKLFSKNPSQKQKYPITLNTLLINGMQQNNNFIVGNLKKYVIARNKMD